MDKPHYTKNPIGRIKSLAKAISFNESLLVSVARQAEAFYCLHERKEKPDGSYRDIYGVKGKLKTVQKRIVGNIYNYVFFPQYLQGSIKDKDLPRSYVHNASLHQNARVLIRMDISNFYPSLSESIIFDVWKRFFNFPNGVAHLLTQLTTYQGFLPQGASTSPGLGNLVFWEREHELVSRLRKQGFVYSRYVDDVSISTKKFIEISDLAPIFSSVFGMFKSRGVKPNRNKIEISTSGHPMIVHNLNVNGTILTMSKKQRRKIGTTVKRCEEKAKESRLTEDYETLWSSAYGKVLYLKHFHPSKAESYLTVLESIKCVLSDNRLAEIENAVNECENLAISSRESLLKKKHKRIQEKVASLSQIYPKQMRPYLDRLQRNSSKRIF